MGSGHVLVYAFDVFINLYKEEGYSEREAAELILTHNLFGLEIDKRAFQLAYFAIMMKGRQYSRRILNKKIKLNVHQFINISNISDEFYSRIEELSLVDQSQFSDTLNRFKALVYKFEVATELGSVINVTDVNKTDVEEFRNLINVFPEFSNMDELYAIPVIHQQLNEMLDIVAIMIAKYEAIVTNPPYLNKMSGTLGSYVTKNYKDVKTDLFSVFIKMNSDLLEENGYAGFMTPFVWMFIKSYEQLRDYLIKNKSISSLIQMEYSAFEEATVPVCCFTIKNTQLESVGNYFKLSDFKGGMKVQEEKVLEGIQNPEVDYFYQTNQENFKKIPGEPISFWVSEKIIKLFENKPIEKYADARLGMATADNNKFLRLWYEINIKQANFIANSRSEASCSKSKWFPYDKGGGFKRWYGNNEYLVNWESDGYEIKNFKNKQGKVRSHNYNLEYIFRKGITWSALSSGNFSCRYSAYSLFDNSGSKIFPKNKKHTNYILGILNSPITNEVFKLINPTMNYQPGTVSSMVMNLNNENEITEKVQRLIEESKKDWDSFETSWEFKKHPLI